MFDVASAGENEDKGIRKIAMRERTEVTHLLGDS
jgi:hypothetical protein